MTSQEFGITGIVANNLRDRLSGLYCIWTLQRIEYH